MFIGIQKPATNEVKSALPDIQSKIARHAKKQENTIHNEDENQSIENQPKTDTDKIINRQRH